MSKYAAVNVKFGADISQFSTAMQNAAREMKKAGDQLQNVGKSMTMNLTAPIVALGAAALYSFGQIDALKRGLISFSGSAQLAEEEFNKLREVAKLPGIGLEEAVRGSINLQAIGMNADKARTAMMAFGNAIATIGGGKENFDLAIRGFGQLMNASKPLQQDLYQIANQLPQVNKLMIEAFGTNRAEDLAKLGISGKQLADFLVVELGKLPQVSGGIKNAFENMSDSVKISLASFGEAIEKNFNISGKINALSDWVSRLAEGFGKLQPWVQKTILTVIGLVAAAGPLLLIIGGIVQIMPTLIAGFAAVKGAIAAMTLVSAPLLIEIGLMLAAIAALAAAGIYMYANWNVIKTKLVNVFSSMADAVLTNIKGIVDGLDWLFSKLGINTFGNASKWFDGLIQSLPDQQDAGKFMTFGESITKTMSDIKKAMFVDNKPIKVSGTKTEETTVSKNGEGLTPEQIKKNEDAKWKAFLESKGRQMDDIKQRNANVIKQMESYTGKVDETNSKLISDQLKTNVQYKTVLDKTALDLDMVLSASLERWRKYQTDLKILNEQISSAIRDSIGNAIIDTMTIIGESIATDKDPFAKLGKNLLDSFGKLMKTIGALMITMGLAQFAFNVSLSSLNPIGMIAAGAVLVAAGAGISAAAKKGLKGADSSQSMSSYSGSSSQGQDLVLTTRLDGRDLVMSGQSTSYVKRR
jgi:tape measure domain-containing protein